MKDKKIIALLGVIIVILIGIVIFLVVKNGKRDTVVNEKSDAVKFAEEYTEIDDDNVFVYSDVDEIIDILESGTGVVYLGFPECKWWQRYVTYLNEVAKSRGIDKIYYYNIRQDRNDNSENYLKIVELIKDYLQVDDEGNPRIYVPAIIFMSDGKIIGFDDETSLDTKGLASPDEYWTDEEINDLKAKLNEIIDGSNICVSCNS